MINKITHRRGRENRQMDRADRTSFEFRRSEVVLAKQKFVKGTIHRFSWHNTIELMVVLSGEMEVFANGVSYLQRENDVLVLGSNCGHAFYPKSADCVIFTTEIAPELLEENGLPIFKYGAVSSNDLAQEPLLWITVRQQLARLLRYIERLDAPDELCEKALEATVVTLFVDLYHQCAAQMGDYLLPPESYRRNDAVREVIAYINENYREKVTLDRAAELTGYNKTYLASLFKKQIGIGIYEYLIRTRMQHGMVMLGDERNSITDIALDCGFADSHSFAAYTKKYCGRSPQEYQKLFAGGGQRVPLDGSQELIQRKVTEYLSLRDDSKLRQALGELKELVARYEA